ncbi:type II secretion system protein J [Sphaerospermopsis sp. LEGE 08334]|uniref:PulJ/GspJ family protein n=1 Tax=Sphaerospermopsis sp. LEGE 08334 TaxID=1828651 RepID=UPI00188091E9|nr:prepilin-type N-terminal cleavage/methylation domain-containing protein [Sphaerospermopsis sp. LEGE 08334]MBE9055659.1 prepilin-type N-terminal cleavage/methylation domain-containing protein [Sphaerospermopsis sp. LEGE 08334]
MKNYLKFIKSNHAADKGFTLIEILVAAAIMSIVVTLAGTAFVALLQQNQKAKAESDRRTNLNRALDYMANEIRMAKKIESPTVAGEVIKLTLPDNSTVSYSIANSSGVWTDTNPTAAERSQSIQRGSNFLVDGIKAPSSGTPTCPTPTPAPTPANQLVGSNGFYACIYSGGKKVDLYLYGKLSDEPRDPNYNKRLEVKSTVYTRAN